MIFADGITFLIAALKNLNHWNANVIATIVTVAVIVTVTVITASTNNDQN